MPVGDSCSNGPWQDRWTCPECYHDHDEEVTACAGCKTQLRCTTERPPISVCTVIDPTKDYADEE